LKNVHSSLNKLDAIFFDFDGVLTNNLVLVSEDGKESVFCNRSDGLGFDALRKVGIKYFIISSEKNSIVEARAKKIRAEVFYGVKDKKTKILDLVKERNFNLENCVYVGNDVNDLNSLKLFGHSFCPNDSHELVKKNVDIILKTNGGNGVVRELLEEHLIINCYEVLYGE